MGDQLRGAPMTLTDLPYKKDSVSGPEEIHLPIDHSSVGIQVGWCD